MFTEPPSPGIPTHKGGNKAQQLCMHGACCSMAKPGFTSGQNILRAGAAAPSLSRHTWSSALLSCVRMVFSPRSQHGRLSRCCCCFCCWSASLTLFCCRCASAPGVRDRGSRIGRVGRGAGGQARRRREQGDGGRNGGLLGSVKRWSTSRGGQRS